MHSFFVSAGGGLHILRLGGEGNRGGWLYTLAVGKRRPISKRIDFFYKAGFEHTMHIRSGSETMDETPDVNGNPAQHISTAGRLGFLHSINYNRIGF